MMRLKRFRDTPGLSDEQVQATWALAAVLLDYPTESLVERLDSVLAAAATLPEIVSAPLTRLAEHLAATPVGQTQRDYVETFDTARRTCLHLTYFTCGDTRRRGVALVQLKQAYRRAGVEFSADELPDHLCAVLEFGATVHVAGAWKILTDYRASVEVLRIALQDKHSPWADAVVAVCATLPALVGDDETAVARLIAQGPPAEDVGVEPYGIDPRLNPLPDYLTAGARP